MIKARIYDEAVAKIGGVTALKLIHICVDYSTRMETILAELRVLFYNRNCFFRGSPVPLEKVPDLALPELLQNLQMPTTLRMTRDSAESGGRPAPRSDARTSEASRPQKEAPTPVPRPALTPLPESTPTPVPKPVSTSEVQAPIPMDTSETPPLPVDPAPVDPSSLATSLTTTNPQPRIPVSAPIPPLSETARKYME